MHCACYVWDIAWAPFLERYRYQLPCLHAGLEPDNPNTYPQLSAWYKAMETAVPPYACRVQGDAASWRKVLTIAGFGNAGLPPQIGQTMEERVVFEENQALAKDDNEMGSIWSDYASTRPYLASSPAAQAAMIVTQNRRAIIKDLLKRGSSDYSGLPDTESTAEGALQTLASLLLGNADVSDLDARTHLSVSAVTSFLDDRMCVPRDMGNLSAVCIKKLAVELRAD